MNSVQEQRDCKHNSAGNDQDIGHDHRNLNPKNMREHSNIEKKSRCFPVPVRAEHRFVLWMTSSPEILINNSLKIMITTRISMSG